MRSRFALLALAAATAGFVSPARADLFSLGNLSAVSPVSSTRTFDALYVGTFTDYYTFKVDAASAVTGTTTETDGYVKLGWVFKVKDLDVSALSLDVLGSNGLYTTLTGDTSPESFSFSTLSGGDYRLSVKGSVVPTLSVSSSSTNGGVSSYTLTAAASATSVAAPVPEASDLALTALGLAGVAFWARRRQA